MWSVAVRWAVGGKKGKKKVAAIPRWTSFIYRCPPLVHWIPTRIEWAIERDAGWQPQSETARISASFIPIRPSRSTPNFASFLLFLSFYFSFFPNRKNARKGRTRNESTKSWASLLRIFSPFENRGGMVRVAKRRLLLSARTFLSLPSILA